MEKMRTMSYAYIKVNEDKKAQKTKRSQVTRKGDKNYKNEFRYYLG